MENFLSNNVLFEDIDDAITFITNIRYEDKNFNILDFIDAPIEPEYLLEYLQNHFKKGAIIDSTLLREYVNNLSEELVSRVYYKNQLMELLKNKYFKDLFARILQYEYFDAPAEEMKADLEEAKKLILDFVYYDYIPEDRYKRAMKDKRQTVITIDTDSVFININKYIHLMDNLLLGLTEKQKDSLVNVFISITTSALEKLFLTITGNKGVLDSAKALINMKQEFLYRRICLTQNKKNYAGAIIAELGKPLPRPILDIKGLPILKKTSVPKALRKEFTKVVEEKILKTENLNISEIIKEYDRIAESIEKSLKDGKTEYLLPKNLEIIEKYKDPSTIEAVRAVLLWNACEPEKQIIPPEKINIIKLNCQDPDDPRLEALKLSHPDKYNAIMKTIWNINTTNVKIDISRFGLSCIAIPKDLEEIPEYIRPFIDYQDMKNTNMQPSYILLESLGVYVSDVKLVKYKSNIIEI